ncbi:hypothetical protein [Actinoplanes sp. NPDC051494]|uniref:hypothetical protein n=1 Tax=Actinoplanes sp. NPDC051494 TaxID=3363907 RepID=UPI00378B357F
MIVRILTAVTAVAMSVVLGASPATAGGPGGDLPPGTGAPGTPGTPGLPTPTTDPTLPGPPPAPDVPGDPPGGGQPGTPVATAPVIGFDLAGPGEVSTLLLSASGSYRVDTFGYRIGDAGEITIPAIDGTVTVAVILPAGTTTVTVRAFQDGTLLGETSTDVTL